ncbi:MAG TPA: ATP-binding cassette domain-containing protein, partial [Mycobacteriales bacterium]|nr:ATP-binding cassette domain-containing protein [Mycobacteriales bacterium]
MAAASTAEARSKDRASGTPLLKLAKVSKNFGPVQALTDVELEIYPGEVVALVGDNGAGKSTMIKTISGMWSPDGGQVFWEGKEVHV